MRLTRDAELVGQDGEGVAVELRVQQQRGFERVEPGVGQRRQTRPAGTGRQVVAVEADVVAGQYGAAGEVAQRREGIAERRCAAHIGVADVHEACDGQRDRHSRVDERREVFDDLQVGAQAHRADVDDPIVLRIQPGGLGVEDDELGRGGGGHGVRIAEAMWSAAAPAGRMSTGGSSAAGAVGGHGDGGGRGDEVEQFDLAGARRFAERQSQGEVGAS